MNKKEKQLFIKMYGKKGWEKSCKRDRVMVDMNTGTRVMKTGKTYSRKAKHKKELYDM